jgi:WXG100 family type VII secretion target
MLNRVKEWFVPPEAFHIAAQFDQQANNIRQQAQRLQQIRANLNQNWMGNSANQFQSEVEPKIRDLFNFADWLSSKADEIRHKEVYRWVWK